MLTTKSNVFPNVHQEKPVRKYDTFITRNMKTQHVSQNNIETCHVCSFDMFPYRFL